MDSNHVDFDPSAPLWEVLEFRFNDRNTDSVMVAMCNGRRVVVYLFAANFSQSLTLKEEYLFFLRVAEEFEVGEYTIQDFYNWIAEPLLPIFRRFSALESPPNCLEDFLFPESYSFTLRADGDSLIPNPYHETDCKHRLFGVGVPQTISMPWPCYKPSDIQPCRDIRLFGSRSPLPSKVLLPDGSSAFLKLMRPGNKRSLLHELNAYQKIQNADLDESVRTSRLLGLVRDDDYIVFGILLTYIDCGARTLSCAVNPSADTHTRSKWAEQIEDTITRLHHAGIAWGDAKPDNVLIDHDDDAWLIDFGGSYTDAWVPKELAETLQGDLVSLGKIKDFIHAK